MRPSLVRHGFDDIRNALLERRAAPSGSCSWPIRFSKKALQSSDVRGKIVIPEVTHEDQNQLTTCNERAVNFFRTEPDAAIPPWLAHARVRWYDIRGKATRTLWR
jgi:hypothetical protein